MLTSVPQLASRARSLQTRQGAVRVLSASNAALLRHRQQIRGFRFGMWSSYLDPDYNREIRRRHRMLKHKCADTLNRRLAWEKHPMAEDARVALKRMVNHYWTSRDPRPGGRYVNLDGFKSQTPENKAGVRPGQNIEDVERGAMEHLFFRSKSTGRDYEYDHWSSPLQNIRKYWAHQQANSAAPKKEVFRTTYRNDGFGAPESDREFVIDPITNRKVAKHPAPNTPKDGEGNPAKTFKDYRSQFSTARGQAPIFYDGPPPAEELRKYRNVKIDHRSEDNDAASQPVIQSEDYIREHGSLPSKASVSSATNFTGFHSEGVSWHNDASMAPEPFSRDTKDQKEVDSFFRSWSASSQPPKYDDLHEYKPVADSEVAPVESSVPQYEDLDEYKPIIDKVPVMEESQPKYKDLDQYEPVIEKETQITEDAEPKYDDLDKYKPVMINELPVEDSTPQYEDLDKYKPVMVNETSVEEPEQPYEDLDKYKPVLVNEPDGKPPGYTEHEPPPPELHKYEAVYYNEPDGKPLGYEEAAVDAAELSQYTAVRYNEPDGKPLDAVKQTVDPAELSQYGAVMWNEPDGQPSTSMKFGEAPSPAELREYTAVRWNEPDGKPAALDQEDRSPSELAKYQPVMYQEPDGKLTTQPCPVQQALQEFDAKKDYTSAQFLASPALDMADESSHEVMRKLDRLSSGATDAEKAEDLDLLRASDIRSSAGSAQALGAKSESQEEKTHYRKMLESLMSKHEITSDAVDREASSAIKSTKARLQAQDSERSLTGNYVRDFPEEFEQTWATTTSESSDASKAAKLESALDRHMTSKSSMSRQERRQASVDPYSTEPQGLETSYAEECNGNPTWPTYVKTYSTSNAESEPASAALAETTAAESTEVDEVTAASPEVIEEPTLYKVLAYDPIMQEVNVAETTSLVTDSASPLPPAEALLRLSSPTKFFPHFAPLQAQGFEIVSGGGDILVFRKVRPALPQAEFLPTSASPEPARANYTPVNPIDMTGSPRHVSTPSTNFASPNGFTTYGPVSDLSTPQQARFNSNIEVRREEPVFSGPKSEPKSKSKPSAGKRVVVGATWVVGISYALGVVGEYFKTGGSDGKGPKGF